MSTGETTHGTADLSWFKSSYSGSNGGECIEVAVAWRKSSYSGSNGGDCVEVAACPETIHVRDSKDTSKSCLIATPEAWAEFVSYAAQRGFSH